MPLLAQPSYQDAVSAGFVWSNGSVPMPSARGVTPPWTCSTPLLGTYMHVFGFAAMYRDKRQKAYEACTLLVTS